MKLFSIIAPKFGPYAAQFRAKDKADCKRQYAAFLGLSRCPNGTQVWESEQ